MTTNTKNTARSKYEALVDALPERDQRLLACRIARWALTDHQVDDPRYWEAVEVSERYANGLATPRKLRAAWNAAWAAREDAWAKDFAWAGEDAAAGAARAAAVADAAWAAKEAARVTAPGLASAEYYQMFFEWALELAIGEKVTA